MNEPKTVIEELDENVLNLEKKVSIDERFLKDARQSVRNFKFETSEILRKLRREMREALRQRNKFLKNFLQKKVNQFEKDLKASRSALKTAKNKRASYSYTSRIKVLKKPAIAIEFIEKGE